MALTSASLDEFYLAYLGRPLDWYGAETFVPFGSPLPAHDAAYSPGSTYRFYASAEYGVLAAGNQNLGDLVNQVYLRLFNRPAEAAGLAYWQGEVAAGRLAAGDLPLGILQGAQNADRTSVENKLAAIGAFLSALDTPLEKSSYTGFPSADAAREFVQAVGPDAASLSAALASIDVSVSRATVGTPMPGITFLTPGTDILNGSTNNTGGFRVTGPERDTVMATSSTLTAGDSVDALGDLDTLWLQGGGVIDTRVATLAGLERVVLNAQPVPFTQVDVGGVTDAQSVEFWWPQGIVRGMNSSVPVELDGRWSGVTRLEFSDAAVAGSQSAHVTVRAGSTGEPNDPTNNQGGTLQVPGIEDLSVELWAVRLDLQAPDAASLHLEVTSSQLRSLAAPEATLIALHADERFGANNAELAALQMDALDVAPGARIELTGTVSWTGTVGPNVAQVHSTSTGLLNVTLTSGSIELQAGAGDDRVTLATALTSGHLDGGAGVDTLVVADASLIDTARITGFEFVEINGVPQPMPTALA